MTTSSPPRAAIYARVSTLDQEPENQLTELRRYIQARGWTGQEYVDHGVSGAKDRRLPWTSSSRTPNAARSMCSWCGDSTAWGAVSAI